MFTKEELESYLKEDLKTLARYYSVSINSRMNKGEIIDAILEENMKLKEAEVELPPMSARVRRIYESQKEK